MSTPKSDAYTFDHEGITVEFRAATVRTELEKRRILLKLMESYGVQNSSDIESSEWDNMSEFASGMAQSKTEAAWWVSSNATPQQIKEAYDLWLEQSPLLYSALSKANVAVSTPKKTTGEIASDIFIVEDFLKHLIAAEKGESDGEIPEVPPPFSHDINTVIHTWLERRMHHIYPEDGGLLDQDADLMRDWISMSIWYVRIEKGASSVIFDDNAPNWMDLARG